jgi:multisubunit Na+/H+ antiporter MnhB subunit
MDKLKRIAAMIALCILTIAANAQPKEDDFMRSNGKIYVVVAVVVTIVIGLFIYLLTLDRKISKIEKRN